MKLFERFSTQYLGTNSTVQERAGLKKLTTEQVKQIQVISLEIYKDIFSVCEQNNLVVMMGGGSTLGAVRHKGFIPWDEDMDLMMMRKDYDRFIELFDRTLSQKYTLNLKSDLPGLFAKVDKKGTKMTDVFSNPKYPAKGIGIDIFPIDSVPDNGIVRYAKGVLSMTLYFVIISRKMYLLRNPVSKRYYSQTFGMRMFYCIRIVIGFLAGLVPYKTLCRGFDKLVACTEETKRVTIASGRKHYFGEMQPADVFLPVKQGEFEGISVYLPHDYDKYLKHLYGNYMEIPPENKREHHAVVDLCLNGSTE